MITFKEKGVETTFVHTEKGKLVFAHPAFYFHATIKTRLN